jgi:hypothetical protein
MAAIRTFLEARTNAEMASAKLALESEFGPLHEENAKAKVKVCPEWNTELQLMCINRYLKSREQYLEKLNQFLQPDSNAPFDRTTNQELNYHLSLMSLTVNIGGDTKPLIDNIFTLALSDDVEVKGIGSALLMGCKLLNANHMSSVLSVFDKHGVCEHPFKSGYAFTHILEYNTDSCALLDDVGRSSSDNIKQSIITSFNQVAWFPDNLKNLVLSLCSDKNSDVSSTALICASMNAELANEITEHIHSGLHSKYWWVRGNCATACGNIKADPDRFIPLLTGLANDFEGQDWNPAERAIQALGKYGPKAMQAIPAIKNALEEWGNNDDDDYFGNICKKAIASITSR